MLKPITITQGAKSITLECRHKETWPPGWSKSGRTPEELRAQGLLTTSQYERARTWSRVCGLQEMSETKCPTCPHAIKENGLPNVTPPSLVAPANLAQRKQRKKR